MTDSKQPVTPGDSLQIRQSYRKMLKASRLILKPDDMKNVRKAVEMSLAGTGLERLPSGQLSIVHSLEVAQITVEEIKLGRTALICSLLYETAQSSSTPIEEIKNHFGEQAANIMVGLAKVFDLYRRKTSIETENFRKLLLTFAQDVRVILIMIADRLHTMRTLDRYDSESQMKTAVEVSYLYAPMAHRLGLYAVKSEMEDLAMKYTSREMYRFIAQKLNETKRSRDKYIAEFIEPLKVELLRQGLKFDIKGRTKSIHSIHNKMKKQGVEFEQVFDLFAIRVILECEEHYETDELHIIKRKLQNEKADCWRAYSVVTDKYQPNPRRMRDWLSVPKSNGYESLHATVMGPQEKWVEVQIRTRRMDEIAELGLAAHWKYKGVNSDLGFDGWLQNIREMIENPERNARDFMENVKLNLYDKEVFIFTPKGDLKRFPKGATVLDFAFDVHTDVGKKCAGAKVNHKIVSIRHVLRNGDTVEIITAPNQHPKQSWLNTVVTSRAKTKLKQALRDIEFRDAELGRETLVRRLKNWKLELNGQLAGQLMKHFKYRSEHDFFCDIANGKLNAVAIKEYIVENENREQEATEAASWRSAENFVSTQPTDVHFGSEVLVIDRNLTHVDYSLAKCCNPIFGDDVFGFVTVSGGIKIHRYNCPNAKDMLFKFGYRTVRAKWTGEAGASYIAAIKVLGNDDIGIVANISQVISREMNLKMRSVSVDSKEGLFEGTVTVFVDGNQTLSTLIRKLSGVKGVLSAVRIDTVE